MLGWHGEIFGPSLATGEVNVDIVAISAGALRNDRVELTVELVPFRLRARRVGQGAPAGRCGAGYWGDGGTASYSPMIFPSLSANSVNRGLLARRRGSLT